MTPRERAAAELADRRVARQDLYALMRRLHRQSQQEAELRSRPLSPLAQAEDYQQPDAEGWDRQAVARGDWQDGDHLRAMCDGVHRALRPGGRLIIEMPPRHGKSQTCSRVLPLFALGRNPGAEVIVATYGQELSNSFGRYVKAQLERPELRTVFPDFQLRGGSSATDRLETTAGGALVYVGAGGAISGRGARLAIIDDPIKNWEDAASEAMREKLWDWYMSVLRTRLSPDGSIVLLHTRWHPDDLIGRVLAQQEAGEGEAWERISLPAVAVCHQAIRLSSGKTWVRKPGDALWPARYDRANLEAIRKASSERVWGALFQQRPTLGGGKYFDVSRVNVVGRDQLPWRLLKEAPKYMAWDLAIKGDELERGDYTTCVVCCRDHLHRIWIVDLIRGHWGAKATVSEIAAAAAKWRPLVNWVEDAHYRGIQEWLREALRQVPGCVPMTPIKPIKDKATRALNTKALVEHSQLYVIGDLEHWPDLRSEMAAFPLGTGGVHDDLVDALAYVCMHSAAMDAHTAQRPAHVRLGSPDCLSGEEFKRDLDDLRAAKAAATAGGGGWGHGRSF